MHPLYTIPRSRSGLVPCDAQTMFCMVHVWLPRHKLLLGLAEYGLLYRTVYTQFYPEWCKMWVSAFQRSHRNGMVIKTTINHVKLHCSTHPIKIVRYVMTNVCRIISWLTAWIQSSVVCKYNSRASSLFPFSSCSNAWSTKNFALSSYCDSCFTRGRFF